MRELQSIANEQTAQKALLVSIERKLRKLSPAPIAAVGDPPQRAVIRAILVRFHAELAASDHAREDLADVAERLYPGDEKDDVRRALGNAQHFMKTRAVTNPADTTTPGWAAELVQPVYIGALPSLAATSVYSVLSARGLAVDLAGGILKLPNATASATPPQVFIGEGKPIPVKREGVGSVTLQSYKVALITTLTEELARVSTPTAEAVLTQLLGEDIRRGIDSALLDDQAGSNIRPAGLRYGVTALTASTATDPAQAAAADISALAAAFDPGAVDFVLITNTKQATNLSLLHSQSSIPVIGTDMLEAGVVIAIDAADFASINGGGFDIRVSNSATLHEEDTDALPIVDGAGVMASPVRTLWQTDSLAVRLRELLGWLLRRPGRVAVVEDVAW
ncbi:phage major capsid protein [Sinorhizobium meliloti]|uniref:phage major capsid family protein n=1 Tax=Rhizobium meliloti TaxID=382 RepID=UPI0012FD912D|nr:phage major capsid protein [Sinorhizobium meliloti]